MSRNQLTYFKTLRLRSGLTQKDVAMLMGHKHHDGISLLESQQTHPSLTTVLFYCAIFGVSVHTLMPHRVHEVEEALIHHAGVLLDHVRQSKRTATVNKRIAVLSRLINEEHHAQNNNE